MEKCLGLTPLGVTHEALAKLASDIDALYGLTAWVFARYCSHYATLVDDSNERCATTARSEK